MSKDYNYSVYINSEDASLDFSTTDYDLFLAVKQYVESTLSSYTKRLLEENRIRDKERKNKGEAVTAEE